MEQKYPGQYFHEILRAKVINTVFRAIQRLGFRDFGEPTGFVVETVPLKLKRLGRGFSGFRIAQISDIHMGGWMNAGRLRHVAELVIAQQPDILVLTGDFLKGRGFSDVGRQGLRDLMEILTPLASAFSGFAVLGNHDYSTNPVAIREMLRECGITDLTNRAYALRRGSETLFLCGVDDVRYGNVRLDEVIAQLEDHHAAILLAHEPDFADTSAATGRFDLQISGHTHGGQIVLPLLGPPILPPSGRKYPSGLYQIGDMFQYTNRGVGTDTVWARINCPPEITIFVLSSVD